MEDNKKELILKSLLKKQLTKEYLKSICPAFILISIISALICIDIFVVNHVFYTVFISFFSVICLAVLIKEFFSIIKAFILVSSNRFTVITDKLYRIGIGENIVVKKSTKAYERERDSSPSRDIYYFGKSGEFIPINKDLRTAFPGDEFYLVVTTDKSKTILKAYNTTYYKYME